MMHDIHVHDLVRIVRDNAPLFLLGFGAVVGWVMWAARQVLVSHVNREIGAVEQRLSAKLDGCTVKVHQRIDETAKEHSHQIQHVLTTMINVMRDRNNEDNF